MKNGKSNFWVFVYIKYGKFESVSPGHFIKHKPLISEERTLTVVMNAIACLHIVNLIFFGPFLGRTFGVKTIFVSNLIAGGGTVV